MNTALKTILTLLLLVSAYTAKAQQGELVVDTMYYDANDLEAQANIVNDNNNQPYALIKIEIPLDGVVVEKNATIGKTLQKTGEVWAYVTADPDYGATDIVLQHSEFHALRVAFAEWGLDELKGKCVYRIRVSVPSAVVAQANRFYEKLRFKDAQEMYNDIVNNESSSEFDRNFARKRLVILPQLMTTNENATLYAKRYIKAAQDGEANKNYIICTLDSAAYWYNRLYQLSSIGAAKSLADKFGKILSEKRMTKVLEGSVSLMYKHENVWVKRKQQKISGVTLEIHYGDSDAVRTKLQFDTDEQGNFSLESKGGYNDTLVFSYSGGGKKYKSTKISHNGDAKLVVVLKEE